MFQPELGVSLHTVSSELTDRMLQAVGSSRIATVEISARLLDGDQSGAKVRLLKEQLERVGIRPMTIHARFGGAYDLSTLDQTASQDAISAIGASIDLASELELPVLVVHASAEPVQPHERSRRLKQAQGALAQIGEQCQKVGKKVAIELLPRSCLGNTVEELFELVDGLPEDRFGFCLDTNHLMGRYRYLARDVHRMGHRLIALHLSDYDGVDEQHRLPGKGVIDWRSFMGALRDVDYGGPFNYECKLEGESVQERVRSLEENFCWLCAL